MLINIGLIIIGYLFGSLPWGLIIGKFFYDKDIRDYGSGNLGGTNAARVLGFHVGVIVIVLDALKALIAMIICHYLKPGLEQYIGLAACFGHCFPIFAGFKGGKAVSSAYGYLLGLSLYVTHEFMYTFVLPIAVFFIVLLLSRMVSLSSMCGITSASIFILLFVDKTVGLLVFILALFIIYRHSANIKRIINGTESKILNNK